MNDVRNDSPSKGIVVEVFQDSDAPQGRWYASKRLKDRTFISVQSSSFMVDETEQVDDKSGGVLVVHNSQAGRNKAMPLTKGYDDIFVDVDALRTARHRGKDIRLKEVDIAEIPFEALYNETKVILQNRLRSRKDKTSSSLADPKEDGKTSRIGKHYQATIDINLEVEKFNPADCGVDQIWDPQKAAMLSKENLDSYLNQSKEFSIKMLLLEALHAVDYDLENATRMFYKMHAKRRGLSATFSDDEFKKFDLMCKGSVIGKRKDFREAARRMNRSVETILVQYYIWKAKNRPIYNALKNRRRREPEECSFCKDGGLLIVCHSCCRAFHLECLQPKLVKIPDGDWYCSLCTQHSPSRLRRSRPIHGDDIVSTKLDANEQLNGEMPLHSLPKKNMENRLRYLKLAHKEFSVLTRKQESLKRKRNTTTFEPHDAPKTETKLTSDTNKSNGTIHVPSERHFDKRSSKKTKTETIDSAELLPFVIDLTLPICPEGFRIVLGSREDGSIVFVKYARGPNGEKGYAEACNLFDADDIITHVDGESCEKDIQSAVKYLLTPSDIGVKVIRIRRNSIGPSSGIHVLRLSHMLTNGPNICAFLLPILPEGFFLELVETSTPYGSVCKIDGYRNKNGQKGFAELYNLFRPGDEIVQIDERSCAGVKLSSVVKMFRESSLSGWRAIRIRRYSKSARDTRKKEKTEISGSKGPQKIVHPSFQSKTQPLERKLPVHTKNEIQGPQKVEQGSKQMDLFPFGSSLSRTTPHPNAIQGHFHSSHNNLRIQPFRPFRQHPPCSLNGNGLSILSPSFAPNMFQRSGYQSMQSNQASYSNHVNNSVPSNLRSLGDQGRVLEPTRTKNT